MKTILLLFTLLIILSLISCGGKTPLPAGSLPSHAEQAADDIIPTPGGGSYRANVTEAGQKNPFEPVQVGMNTWTVGKETVAVFYRSDILAKAGESHTDMIVFMGSGALDREKNKLVLYADSIPQSITVTDAAYPVGAMGTLGTVAVITADPGVKPGDYTVTIGIMVDGKDYGSVPCRITVAE